MEMSIEEAILQLEECKAYKQCDTEKDLNALDVAITTMRKYQHITEIVEAWKADIDVDSCDCMEDIEGVLNGNDD